MGPRYARAMDVIPPTLARAARDARDRLTDLSRTAATTNATPGSPAAAGAMAAAAREAIFADALLAAMHARFQAIKNVAK